MASPTPYWAAASSSMPAPAPTRIIIIITMTHRLNEQLAIAPPADTRYRRVSSRLSARKSEIFKHIARLGNQRRRGWDTKLHSCQIGNDIRISSCSDKQAVLASVDMKVTLRNCNLTDPKNFSERCKDPCNVFPRPTLLAQTTRQSFWGNPNGLSPCLNQEGYGFGVASGFGSPAKVKERANTRTRPSFSMMCVEAPRILSARPIGQVKRARSRKSHALPANPVPCSCPNMLAARLD